MLILCIFGYKYSKKMQDRQFSTNCAINKLTMIRNICILSLFVFSVQASVMNPTEVMETAKNVAVHVGTVMSGCVNDAGAQLKDLASPTGALNVFKTAVLCFFRMIGLLDNTGGMNQALSQKLMDLTKGTMVENLVRSVVESVSNKGNANNPTQGMIDTFKALASGPVKAAFSSVAASLAPMVMQAVLG